LEEKHRQSTFSNLNFQGNWKGTRWGKRVKNYVYSLFSEGGTKGELRRASLKLAVSSIGSVELGGGNK